MTDTMSNHFALAEQALARIATTNITQRPLVAHEAQAHALLAAADQLARSNVLHAEMIALLSNCVTTTTTPALPGAEQPRRGATMTDDDTLTLTHTPELEAMVRHMLAYPDGLPWTLQGFGMLRCDIDGRDYRLNVWDARYRRPNVAPIHDHPWDLESLCMSGTLTNVRYVVDTWAPHEGVHSHWCNVIQPGADSIELERPKPVRMRPPVVAVYHRGDGYSQTADEIHETRYTTGTVTLTRRTNRQTDGTTGDKARVFWHKDQGDEWVDAIPQEATPEKVRAICEVALAVWGEYPPEVDR